ncbi:MAG: iron-containing alcohol dehydrogenase [Actinomycetota bacterium]|nr:iron-containing alcohol dehydrogenase [Actinomycetota bacterium]
MTHDFTWRDGERLIRFARGAVGEAPRLLAQNGYHDYVLLTTDRARDSVPDLVESAATVADVPPGKVDEISASLLLELDAELDSLVAVGGGRVIDTAKAIAGAMGGHCAAIPTTLSGAELTPFHRLPAGVEGAQMVRPALVVADPELMTSAPLAGLVASAMNALAHAMEALYTPLANPVTDGAALRSATLLADGAGSDPPGREALALGALLAGYASGSTGIAVHHALCQTIVRATGSPHAETNAVMLPHTARLMAGNAPGPMSELALALGDRRGDPNAAAAALAPLAARCGHTRLSTLGVTEDHLPGIVALVAEHPLLANTPQPPGEEELLAVLKGAL